MREQFNNHFLWYELMTDDTSRAEAFYRSVIGWDSRAWEGANMPYTMLLSGEQPIAGLMEITEKAKTQGAQPCWMAYIGTTDLTQTMKKASSLGARILLEEEVIPEIGRIGILLDPTDALLGIYEPDSNEEIHGPETKPGHIAWHELLTSDPAPAWQFYSSLFGWKKGEVMHMGKNGDYQMFAYDEQQPIGGMMKTPADMGGPSQWLYYITVSDLNSALDQVRHAGGQVLSGPIEVPGGDHVAQCLDPSGALFALHEIRRAVPDTPETPG